MFNSKLESIRESYIRFWPILAGMVQFGIESLGNRELIGLNPGSRVNHISIFAFPIEPNHF
jgi:hypothetical protein